MKNNLMKEALYLNPISKVAIVAPLTNALIAYIGLYRSLKERR